MKRLSAELEPQAIIFRGAEWCRSGCLHMELEWDAMWMRFSSAIRNTTWVSCVHVRKALPRWKNPKVLSLDGVVWFFELLSLSDSANWFLRLLLKSCIGKQWPRARIELESLADIPQSQAAEACCQWTKEVAKLLTYISLLLWYQGHRIWYEE